MLQLNKDDGIVCINQVVQQMTVVINPLNWKGQQRIEHEAVGTVGIEYDYAININGWVNTKGRAIRPYEPHVEWHRMKVVVLTSTVTAWEKVVWVNHAMVLKR